MSAKTVTFDVTVKFTYEIEPLPDENADDAFSFVAGEQSFLKEEIEDILGVLPGVSVVARPVK